MFSCKPGRLAAVRSDLLSNQVAPGPGTTQRKDAGRGRILDERICPTEDKLQGERLAAVRRRPAIQAGQVWMRRFPAAAPPTPRPDRQSWRSGARGRGINHLDLPRRRIGWI